MGIQEMTGDINCLKDYAVRIEDANSVGSGFLVAAQDGAFVYIFTALHVIIHFFHHADGKLCFDWKGQHFECGKTELEYGTLYPELDRESLLGQSEDRIREIVKKIAAGLNLGECPDSNRDVAVLRIPGNKLAQGSRFGAPVACMEEAGAWFGLPFRGLGFPNRKKAAIGLEGTCLQWDAVEELWTCQAQGMGNDFVEAMHGFSGTGITAEVQGRRVLVGFAVSCDTEEKHQCFQAVGVSRILAKMEEMGWETPDRVGQGGPPENFWSEVTMFAEDLRYMEPEVKKGLRNILYKIDRDGTPGERAGTEVFYDIPACGTERPSCPTYWKGRYWTICICRILNGEEEDSHYLCGDGKSLEIAYICTEGNGDADIATVVASAIAKKVLGSQISGDSILVWQSAKRPDRNLFPKGKFKNIVENIASGNLYEVGGHPDVTGYDLLNGEMREKDYGILHINYLLSKLEECESMDQVEKKVREVLEDVWR